LHEQALIRSIGTMCFAFVELDDTPRVAAGYLWIHGGIQLNVFVHQEHGFTKVCNLNVL
jgi:hypothetical protein